MVQKHLVKFPLFAKVPLIISFVIVAILIATSTFYFSISQPEIPLFYSLARPEQSLVSNKWIFLLPTIGLTIAGLHMFLLSILNEMSTALLKIFAWLTVVLEILILGILIRIVLITL